MLNMTDETKSFLQSVLPDIPLTKDNISLLLDKLDDMMLDSLDGDYNPTSKTAPIIKAYDDIFNNND